MALIECPECGQSVSDRAVACPNCGYPVSAMIEKTTFTTWVASICMGQACQKTLTQEQNILEKQRNKATLKLNIALG